MTLSQLQSTIQQFRVQLLAHEATAERILEAAYQHTLAQLQPRLDALYQQMSDAQANLGEDEQLPLSWLYESSRLEAVKSLIEQQIGHFGAMAEQTTAQLQHFGVTLGGQAGQALLNASVPAGISLNFSFGMPSLSAIQNLIGATQIGSPLADLFKGFGAEAAKTASDALITGITLGHNPRAIAPSVQQALNVPRWRALTVARTEMLRSYRSSQQMTFQQNSNVVGQWRWTCALSSRTCAACIAMDGSLHDLDESMDSHPNCRCTMVPVTKSWDDILSGAGIDGSDIEDANPASDMQTGSDWFASQDESVQRQVLGSDAAYTLYASGNATLQDFVGIHHDAEWGSSIYQKSVRQITKGKR